MRYRDAGVDLARSDASKRDILRAVQSTWSGAVRPLIGGFAGVMELPGGGGLVAATIDGVGTKLHLGLEAGRVGDAAADLVYHGANDLLVHGAKPLAFLDYVAQSRLNADVVLDVVTGIARACREVGAALLGGETAEMPDTYLEGVVDVAGCMIGTLAPGALLDGSAARPGDAVLGLGSAGLHTNGFSLARRILAASGLGLDDPLPGTRAAPGGGGEAPSGGHAMPSNARDAATGGAHAARDGGGGLAAGEAAKRTIGDALLAPHRWYGPALAPLLERGVIRALAHVTGGGIAGNLVRVLPEGVGARIDARAWERPAVFRWLIDAGRVPEEDARTSFNLGIGMIVVVAPGDADAIAAELQAAGEIVHRIGALEARAREVRWTDP